MLTPTFIAGYLLIALIAMRIALGQSWRYHGEIGEESWLIGIFAGLFWPLALALVLCYQFGRLAIRPLIIPAAMRRAERERRASETEWGRTQQRAKDRELARKNGLPFPEDS